MILLRRLSGCNHPKTVRSSMACMSAFSAVAVRRNARLGGGTLRNTVALLRYYKPYVFYWTAVIARALNDSKASKTPSAYFVAAVLVIALGSAQKDLTQWARLAGFDWS